MHMKNLLLLLLWACSLSLQATAFSVTRIPTLEQLPVNAIHRIFQDSEGYMWYGTVNGLCRDDGYRIRIFRSDFHTPGILRDNLIAGIAEDRTGRIWFTTNSGAYVLDKKDYRIREVDHRLTRGHRVEHVFTTRDGSVWMGVQGWLLRYLPDSTWKEYPLLVGAEQAGELNGFCEDRKGRLLVTLKRGAVFLYDRTKDKFVNLTEGQSLFPGTIRQDEEEDCYWLATWGKGIARLTIDSMRAVVTGSAAAAGDEVIFFTQKGRTLWATSSESLLTYGIHDGMACPEEQLRPLPHKMMLNEIIQDRHGDLWVSAFDCPSFIIHASVGTPVLYHLPALQERCGYHPAIMALSPADSGPDLFWMFQEREGLFLYDLKKDRIVSQHSSRQLEYVKIMEKAGGKDEVWVCPEYGREVFRFAYRDGRIHLSCHRDFSREMKGAVITCLHETAEGFLWIGTDRGLFLHDLQEHVTTRIAGIDGFVSGICAGTRGTMYCCTRGKGVYAVGENDNVRRYAMRQPFNCIAYADDGTLWLGTDEGELLSLSRDGHVRNHTRNCDLDGDMVNRILTDEYGHVWLSCNKRIIEYAPAHQTYYEYRTTDNGSGLWRVIPTALCRGNDGTLLFGGIPGICRLSPSNSLDKEAVSDSVKITDVLIDGKSVLFDYHKPLVPLQISHEARQMTICFSSLRHRIARQIRYAYRLKGFDEDWQKTGDGNPCAIYQNLPKGTYTFEVKATDENGRWGETVTAFSIERTPACYETWWAYVLYIIFLCALTFGIVRYYLSRAQKRNERLWAEAGELLNMRNYLIGKLDGQCEETENLNRIFVERARQIVEQHLADPDLSVESLAGMMNMSRSTFTRKIKSIIGRTPSEFIRQIKMAYARKMVLSQDRSISEIATALGFSDRKHFTSSFKEEFGMPPTAYQKMHKDDTD